MNKKKTTFVTFGQDHTHRINGKTIDADCVAVIEADTAMQGRDKAFELFGPKFCFEYFEDAFDESTLEDYYPRGIIKLN